MINKVSESYKHHILIIALGPFLKIIEAIFDLLIPLIMKAIIDLSQYSVPEDIPNIISSSLASLIRVINPTADAVSDALTGGAIILVMGVVGYVITMVSQYLAARASVDVGTEVRSALFAKTLAPDLISTLTLLRLLHVAPLIEINFPFPFFLSLLVVSCLLVVCCLIVNSFVVSFVSPWYDS